MREGFLNMNFFIKAILALIVGLTTTHFLQPRYPIPEIFGTVEPGFEEVVKVFRENFEQGLEKNHAGSAFSAYYQGQKVVDLWAGYADAEAGILWKEDSLSIMYATTKGVVALVMAMLADRDLIDFKKPVVDYWESFEMKSKADITVEMVLEHEAGLPIIFNGFDFDLLGNRDQIDQDLMLSELVWAPGTAHGYHALTYGLLADAIARRVDPRGRTIGEFFREEVADPFDIDIYIGTPKEQHHRLTRAVPVEPTYFDVLGAFVTDRGYREGVLQTVLDKPTALLNQLVAESCRNVCQWWRYTDPDLINLEFSSMTGTATARGVAKLFGILANGGKLGNKTLLSEKYIDEYKYDKRGESNDLVLFGFPTRWKYGMHILPQHGNETEAANMFGSSGHGGQLGYADPGRKVGYGYLTRYMAPVGVAHLDSRPVALIEATQRAVDIFEEQA